MCGLLYQHHGIRIGVSAVTKRVPGEGERERESNKGPLEGGNWYAPSTLVCQSGGPNHITEISANMLILHTCIQSI